MNCNSCKRLNGYSTVFCVFVLIYCNSDSAFAFEWTNDYGVSATLGFDDNFRLSEDDELDSSWLDLGLFTDLIGATEISEIRLAVGVNHASYSESSIANETSYNLSFESSRTGERLDSFLDASLVSELTTETELLDSGFTEEDGTRNSFRLSPGLAYRIDERNTVTGSLTYEDVNYNDIDLIEYSQESLRLGWRYLLGESSSVSAGLEFSVYDPEDGDETDTNSVNVGYRRQISEATGFDISMGYTDMERADDSEGGSNFSFGVAHETNERDIFNLRISKTYAASGLGSVREEDRLVLQWGRGLSERAQATVSAEGVSADERDYYSISVGGNYLYTREVRLSGSYRYRERDEVFVNADSSTLLFSLSYSPI